jgi:hypothetical protein
MFLGDFYSHVITLNETFSHVADKRLDIDGPSYHTHLGLHLKYASQVPHEEGTKDGKFISWK